MQEIDNLIPVIRKDVESVKGHSGEGIYYDDCFKSYELCVNGKVYYIRFNLLTLDYICNELPKKIIKEIWRTIKSSDIIDWDDQNECRPFFMTLELSNEVENLYFIYDDKPDFIVFKGNIKIGYEVTRAADDHGHYTQYERILFNNSGKERSADDYKQYIREKHRNVNDKYFIEQKDNTIVTSPNKGLVSMNIFTSMIHSAILKKVNKYPHYENKNVSKKNIIVFTSQMGFSLDSDFNDVSKSIETDINILNSDIDEINVLNVTGKILVKYDKKGRILKVYKNSV